MSGNIRARLGLAAALIFSVVAFACGHDGPADPGTSPSGVNGSEGGSTSGGGASGGGATGTLAIHLTDSPFSEAEALLVSFSEVSVHRADPGEWKTVATTRTCDLKKLNGATDVLGIVGGLPVGKYTQIRLHVSSADLYFQNKSAGPACAPTIAKPDGSSAPVTIPSGEVKLNNEFTLTSAGTMILLDFDGDQSVHQTGSGNGRGNGNGANGRYMMSPVIRVVSVQ